MNASRPSVLFLSSITLREDDPTERQKWSRMSDVFNITVICFAESGFGRIRQFGCTFLTLPARWPLPLRLLTYYGIGPLLVFYSRLVYGSDVWIAQSPYEAGAAVCPKIMLAPFVDSRLVVEAHGDWISSFLELRLPPFPELIENLLEFYSSVVLWFADAYRSISEETRNLLHSYGNPDRPHVQFPGYMDVETFLDCTLEEKKHREQTSLLYVGALTKLKGLEFLLEVFRGVRRKRNDLQLRLCGRGPDEAFFRERSQELGTEEAVSFEGYLPTEQVKQRMLQARLVLLPSRTEGFGRVLVEGLATYTPFVATPNGGPIEIADRSQGGCIVEADRQKWTEMIIDLVNDSETRRRMGQSGRTFVEETYSTDSYVDHYRTLVQRTREG